MKYRLIALVSLFALAPSVFAQTYYYTQYNAPNFTPAIQPYVLSPRYVYSTGVLPQRLRWQTYTNTAFSYALSYPYNWYLLNSQNFVSVTDGRASVSVTASDIAPGTNAAMFAGASGVAAGALTIKINGYTAVEVREGINTAYYITNGAVGYKLVASPAYTANEATVIRAILIEFTVTRQR